MWDLISNPFQAGLDRALIPLVVFIAAFLGSWHCVGMCGGLVAAAAPTRKEVCIYHFGRLLGYLALGFLAGLLGEKALSSATRGILPWIAALGLGGAFVFMGVIAWKKPGRKSSASFLIGFYSRLWGKILRRSESPFSRAFSMGFMSVFLPCGWLYTFVLGAVATGSPLFGSLFLFAFWLGSLPGLFFAPLFFRRLLQPLSQKMPKMAAVILILVGLIALGWKITPLIEASSTVSPSSHCIHPKM